MIDRLLAFPRLELASFWKRPLPLFMYAILALLSLGLVAGGVQVAAGSADTGGAKLAINAGENARALALTRELSQAVPDNDDAMQLALDLMPSEPQAETLITERLRLQPDQPALRQAYGRALIKAQRQSKRNRISTTITKTHPKSIEWLRFFRDRSMNVAGRKIVVSYSTSRMAGARSDIAFSTLRVTSKVLAQGCFSTISKSPGRLLIIASPIGGA